MSSQQENAGATPPQAYADARSSVMARAARERAARLREAEAAGPATPSNAAGFATSQTPPGEAVGAAPEAVGALAWAAAALALFAPATILILALTDAPLWAMAPSALGALPLAAAAGAASLRPTSLRLIAWAHAPLIAAAVWLTWVSGGLLSPIAPWVFAGLAAAAILGGGAAALIAAATAVLLGVAAAAAPEPPVTLIGYAPRADRHVAAALSWGAAAGALGMTAWAATRAWASALPPLRHPTIAARRALARLVEDSGVAGLRLDEAGAVRQVIGAPESAFDMPARELIGVAIGDMAHPDDRASLDALIDHKHADGGADGPEGLTTIYMRLRSRYGGFRWVEAAVLPARGYPQKSRALREGSLAHAAAEAERLLIVRARRRAETPAGAAEGVDKAGLLAHVHDGLRQELKAIVGYTDILRSEIFGPIGGERYREYARLAHDGGAHLLELVDELLELAAVDAGRVGAADALIDPVPVIDGAVRLAGQRADTMGVALEADAPPSTPHMRADRRALRRVLINLLVDVARRARMGDRLLLRVEAEETAISFKISVVHAEGVRAPRAPLADDRPRLAGAAGAQPTLEPPVGAQPDMANGPAADAAEQNGVSELSEARLGRLVALSLADRMSGGLLFADGDDVFDPIAPGAPGSETAVVEAIFPLGAAVDAGSAVKGRGALFGGASGPRLLGAPRRRIAPAAGPAGDAERPDSEEKPQRRTFGLLRPPSTEGDAGGGDALRPLFEDDEASNPPTRKR